MREVLKALVESDGVVFALVVLAAAYALRQFADLAFTRLDERRRRGRFIAALYAEIAFNTRDLERFLADAPSPATVKAVLRARKVKAIHMTDARHTAIYAGGMEALTSLPRAVIGDVVAFYNKLERIKVQTDALERESFREITDAGRDQVVDLLWSSIDDAASLGRRALYRFEIEGATQWALARD